MAPVNSGLTDDHSALSQPVSGRVVPERPLPPRVERVEETLEPVDLGPMVAPAVKDLGGHHRLTRCLMLGAGVDPLVAQHSGDRQHPVEIVGGGHEGLLGGVQLAAS